MDADINEIKKTWCKKDHERSDRQWYSLLRKPEWRQPDKFVVASNIETQHNFLPTKFWQRHQFYCKIVLKMTWLGEIGKIYRDSVKNLRENMNLRSKQDCLLQGQAQLDQRVVFCFCTLKLRSKKEYF